MIPYTQVEIFGNNKTYSEWEDTTVTLKQSNGFPVAQSKFDTKEKALAVASQKIKEITK